MLFFGLVSIFVVRIKRSFIVVVTIYTWFSFLLHIFFVEPNTFLVIVMRACIMLLPAWNRHFCMLLLPFHSNHRSRSHSHIRSIHCASISIRCLIYCVSIVCVCLVYIDFYAVRSAYDAAHSLTQFASLNRSLWASFI